MAVVPLTCQATSRCLTWCLPNNQLPHCPSVWAPFKTWLTPQLLTTVFQMNFSNSVKCSTFFTLASAKETQLQWLLLRAPLGNKCCITLDSRENNCYGTREQCWETWFKEEKPQVHWDWGFGSELVLSWLWRAPAKCPQHCGLQEGAWVDPGARRPLPSLPRPSHLGNASQGLALL